METKLSILVCTVPERIKNGQLATLIEELDRQAEGLPVEVLISGDLANDQAKHIGEKRNDLYANGRGLYSSTVDDDDWPEPDYVSQLLSAMASNPDVICFQVMNEQVQASRSVKSYFSIMLDNEDKGTYYNRTPNHVMCIKSSIAKQVKFDPISHGEDTRWSKEITPLLKTEVQIDKVLYTYRADMARSESFRRNMLTKRTPRDVEGEMDMVIVSDAKTEELRGLTMQTIQTGINTAMKVNPIIVEENRNLQWAPPNINIYQTARFNYNRYLNEGAMEGKGKYIAFCNNDIKCMYGWAEELAWNMERHDAHSSSPFCPKCHGDEYGMQPKGVMEGYQVRKHMPGWCFVMRRETWEKHPLPEDWSFWCSDNETMEMYRENQLKHIFVGSAQVIHIGSATLKTLDSNTEEEYTMGQVRGYNQKHGVNLFGAGDTIL